MLFIGGGIETVPGIMRAHDMGLWVVVSDQSVDAPACQLADACLHASTYDVAVTVSAAEAFHLSQRPIDGVLCLATDVPLTVASVAAALNLPGIPPESARLAMDKLAMKERFKADGVPVPWFRAVRSAAELKQDLEQVGLPLVLKPVDSRGARGVLRLAADTDLDWAYGVALAESPSGRVMVERFIDGPQVSTESMVVDGIAHTPGFSDRNYELLDQYAPYVIENGGELPTALDEHAQAEVRALVQKAALSLGVHNGVVKGDVVVSSDGPYIIELAARLSGGYFCTHEIPLSTGVDFVGHAIRMALGDTPSARDLAPRCQHPVVQRYHFPTPGQVVSIHGADEVASRPGVALCEIRVKCGDVVASAKHHPARAGVVIATGECRAQALERAVSAIRDIKIETVPLT